MLAYTVMFAAFAADGAWQGQKQRHHTFGGGLEMDSTTRHLNLFPSKLAGIADRKAMFWYLNGLAAQLGAVPHIIGGAHRADLFLTNDHSEVVSPEWETYLDTHRPPFTEVVSVAACKNATDKDEDLYSAFDDGSTCVNIRQSLIENVHKFDHVDELKSMGERMNFSTSIYGSLNTSLDRLGLEVGSYGGIHIRRMDRMDTNSVCTQADKVASAISKFPEIEAWYVNYYAEEDYKPKLKQALRSSYPEKRFIFEDEDMTFKDERDNYIIGAAAYVRMANALATYQTHVCEDDEAEWVCQPSLSQTHGDTCDRYETHH
mmetsp:Transcript_17161/g.32665  ORF Transcript_17161/g.32665 Transcript_17161/m.32665 type:complete len:317 (-) Transcript_17161:268-1218(-)